MKKAPPTTEEPKTNTPQSHRLTTPSTPIPTEDKLLFALFAVVITYAIWEVCR